MFRQASGAVFVDRDGCINRMVYDPEHGLADSPQRPECFHLLPLAAEGIRFINQMNLPVVVVSNQPGIAKGKTTSENLDAITGKMQSELAQAGARLDAVYYCLHHPDASVSTYRIDCNCRKPKPGLLQRAADELGIDLKMSVMVGDGLTDVLAGRAAGCKTVLLGTRKCDICKLAVEMDATPDFVAGDLLAAAKVIGEVVFPEAAVKFGLRTVGALERGGENGDLP